MRIRRWSLFGTLVVLGLLVLGAYEWQRLSCYGLLPFSGWVLDEAKCAGVPATQFRAAGLDKKRDAAERAYFSKMDGGIKLTEEESAGRIMWMVWTAGNDRFWDETVKHTFGTFDFLKTLSSNPQYGFCTEHEHDPTRYKGQKNGYPYPNKEDYAPYLSEDEAYWLLNKEKCKEAGGTWVPISRDNRWRYFGLVNEPCFEKAMKPDEFGLWLDKRIVSKECPPDPFEDAKKYPGVVIGAREKGVEKERENEEERAEQPERKKLLAGSYYGKASGVLGLRLFPNPAFDQEARDKWDAEKFYTDPTYYNDKDLIRPYRVGMSCAFCHVGPDPVRPPKDPENPKWENLSSTVGAQYLWLDRAFLWNPQDHKNWTYQLVHTNRPGTFDTSLVSSDNINNPRTMNAIYYVAPRLKAALRWGKEKISGANLENDQFNNYPDLFIGDVPTHAFFQPPDTVWTPRVLRDGSDSVSVLGSLNRVYLNIGTFSEEWLLHFWPFVGATPFSPITPIKITDAEKNSVYWQATKAQALNMVQFLLKADKPHRLKEALEINKRQQVESRDESPTEETLPSDSAPQKSSQDNRYLENACFKISPGQKVFQEADQDVLNTGKDVFADYCARCHSSKIPRQGNPLDDPSCSFGKDYLKCWQKYWNWTKTPGFKSEMRKLVRSPGFLKDNYLSTDVRIPVTLLGTNICSPLASNAIAGDIWDNFSSQSYKDLPAVGSVNVLLPWKKDEEDCTRCPKKTHTYQMPAGGRGYTRPPSLSSLWSTGPFLQNNSLGDFCPDPSIEERMASFEDSITKLLSPDLRRRDKKIFPESARGTGIIDRTTVQSDVSIPAGYLPDLVGPLARWLSDYFPWVLEPTGDIKIGPIPKGTPVNLLANLDLSKAGPFLWNRARPALKKLPQVSSDEQARRVLAPLKQDLLGLSRCPDFVVNKGHYFGTEFAGGEKKLEREQKRALIEFLKTF